MNKGSVTVTQSAKTEWERVTANPRPRKRIEEINKQISSLREERKRLCKLFNIKRKYVPK